MAATNRWWRQAEARSWQAADRQLAEVAEAPFTYQPGVLDSIRADGLYLLLGPRRVGKSVELKRAIARLLEQGADRHAVIHAGCDGWSASDLVTLSEVAQKRYPASKGPRYFFLDEITAIKDDWAARIKWLRDQTPMRDDCLVLSGSSSDRLEEAKRELAGRRGRLVRGPVDLTLLPMGFRAFARSLGFQFPELDTVHPAEVQTRRAKPMLDELNDYLDDLVLCWEQYLEVGGFPKAVVDYVEDREISVRFIDDLWDALHGDALSGSQWTALQSQELIRLISQAIAYPFNQADAARDLGDVHHDVVNTRLRRLQETYVAWPCCQIEGNRPKLNAQRKWYFLDPIHARLAHLRHPNLKPPDYTQLTEQQIGVSLLRAHEREAPGTLTDYDSLMYLRTASRNEIDFVGPWLRRVPYEGKYTEGAWVRETQTMQAQFGRGVLATRNVYERTKAMLAVPAPALAYLVDPG
jgi:predicted AAA+ superfamily ATPase